MKVNIQLNIEKKHLVFLVVFTLVVFAIGATAYINPHTGVGHGPEEIGPGTFGLLETNTVFTFPHNLNVNNLLTASIIKLGGVEKTAWPEGVPQGFCVFSETQTACPAGWTRASGLDGRTIRGSSVPGGTGGAEDHLHDLPSDKCYHSGSDKCSNDGTTYKTSSWPPYENVILCCKQ